MRVTTRGQYGVRAMFDLALRAGGEPVPLREIAERQGLPEHYLEQLIGPLRKAGLVRSVRGAQGGYMLARDPSEITIGDILRVLEGPIAPTECAVEEAAAAECCPDGPSCVVRGVWMRIRDAINDVIDRITLAELREQELVRRSKQAYTYYI